MRVAIFILFRRGAEMRQRVFVSPGLRVGPAERRAGRDGSAVRSGGPLEKRDRAIDLLALQQRVAIHQGERPVVGPFAIQPLEQRERFVEVVRAQEGLRQRDLDRRICRRQLQGCPDLGYRVRIAAARLGELGANEMQFDGGRQRLEPSDRVGRQPVGRANRPVPAARRQRLHGSRERLTKLAGEKVALGGMGRAFGGRAPLDRSQFLGGPLALPRPLV